MHIENITQSLVSYLSGIEDATTMPIADFNAARPENVVVVDCRQVNQLNLGCGVPDYEVVGTIVVDSMISEDRDATTFNAINNEVFRRIAAIADHDVNLEDVFSNSQCVVAFFYDRSDTSLLEHSNRAVLNVRIIVSE